jgi:hypothetical protein
MAKNPGMPFCSPSGACTAEMPPACFDSDDCTASATAPICDTTAGECTSCTDADGDAACELRDNGNAPYCVTEGASAGACAACLDSTHCTEAAPVCDAAAGTCGACKEHSDCAEFSGVCDAGVCADESEVVYVREMNSSDVNDCSRGTPCTTITRGLAAVATDNQNKHFIRILDNANYSGISLSNVTVSIIGSNGTRITAITDSQPAITVGAETSLTLDTLTIRSIGINADGVSCRQINSTLRVENVIIRDNANLGIDINSCRLEVARSVISGNLGGGIKISDAAFTITNSYIIDNGSETAPFGGIQILNGLTRGGSIAPFLEPAR